jgi:hypothetical protein
MVPTYRVCRTSSCDVIRGARLFMDTVARHAGKMMIRHCLNPKQALECRIGIRLA